MTPEAILAKAKARTCECGECWLWEGAVGESGAPRWGHTSTRRRVWQAAFGPIPEGKLVSVNCNTALCVAPDHLVLTTKAQVSRKANTAAVRMKRSRSMQPIAQQRGKLTADAVAEIRSSNLTLKELGRRFGVHFSLIGRVRNGQAWKVVGNPFAGLGAR